MPEQTASPNRRIINCHTHIFTGDYVPPYLAKTMAGPLYFLFPITLFIRFFRWWFKSKYSPYRWRFQTWYKKLARGLYRAKIALTRYWILRIAKFVIGVIILASMFYEVYTWKLRDMLVENGIGTGALDKFHNWLGEKGIVIITDSFWLKAFLLVLLLLFFTSGKNLLLFVLRQTSRFFKMLPGKQTTEMIKRYVNIVRYARYLRQSDIFTKLTAQYPIGTGMIVLPMDMEFMAAGKPLKPYRDQMEELAKLKKSRGEQIYPFIFIDPRRTHVGDQLFFDYDVVGGKVILKDCFVKEYIEDKKFSGFKIYPALGYYPFDENLLALWKYAADNGIPLMTHCIRGVIYYRGSKKNDWDEHPVFKQAMGKNNESPDADEDEPTGDKYQPMLLPQMRMVDLQEVFTHPLNYLCLLDPELLAVVIGRTNNEKVKQLFGYNAEEGTITGHLKDLKICFGHFGGDDEWVKYFENDRDNYGSQLARFPDKGINFLRNENTGELKPGKPEQIWKYADWYSIICSLMLQYDHIYADISYILHSEMGILPLLKQTMKHAKLRTRVLYGSDFYVVRNHKSDKNMLTNMTGGLTVEEFEQMAVENPVRYLARQ